MDSGQGSPVTFVRSKKKAAKRLTGAEATQLVWKARTDDHIIHEFSVLGAKDKPESAGLRTIQKTNRTMALCVAWLANMPESHGAIGNLNFLLPGEYYQQQAKAIEAWANHIFEGIRKHRSYDYRFPREVAMVSAQRLNVSLASSHVPFPRRQDICEEKLRSFCINVGERTDQNGLLIKLENIKTNRACAVAVYRCPYYENAMYVFDPTIGVFYFTGDRTTVEFLASFLSGLFRVRHKIGEADCYYLYCNNKTPERLTARLPMMQSTLVDPPESSTATSSGPSQAADALAELSISPPIPDTSEEALPLPEGDDWV